MKDLIREGADFGNILLAAFIFLLLGAVAFCIIFPLPSKNQIVIWQENVGQEDRTTIEDVEEDESSKLPSLGSRGSPNYYL